MDDLEEFISSFDKPTSSSANDSISDVFGVGRNTNGVLDVFEDVPSQISPAKKQRSDFEVSNSIEVLDRTQRPNRVYEPDQTGKASKSGSFYPNKSDCDQQEGTGFNLGSFRKKQSRAKKKGKVGFRKRTSASCRDPASFRIGGAKRICYGEVDDNSSDGESESPEPAFSAPVRKSVSVRRKFNLHTARDVMANKELVGEVRSQHRPLESDQSLSMRKEPSAGNARLNLSHAEETNDQKRPQSKSKRFMTPTLKNVTKSNEEKKGSEVHPDPEIAALFEDKRLEHVDPFLVQSVVAEIVDKSKEVQWDDIAGLEFAKNTLREIIIWPLQRPDIFTGLRGPPKGLLLFGPPGTGKTMIAKAVATEAKTTFFNISASSLMSKWVGEGEKLVRVLFTVAAIKQPSIIFIDEIDSLLSARTDSDFESSRRMKTEFLVQMDGVGSSNTGRVVVLGATNRPQQLDEAARRRLAKRLYIPLPCGAARRHLVDRLVTINGHALSADDLTQIVAATKGFSGSDISDLCTEAAMGPIRDVVDISKADASHVRKIERKDFDGALHHVKASVQKEELTEYKNWNKKFGTFQESTESTT